MSAASSRHDVSTRTLLKKQVYSLQHSDYESSSANLSELRLELQALQETKASLKKYLLHIRTLKQELLHTMNNFEEMDKVNTEWVKELKESKYRK